MVQGHDEQKLVSRSQWTARQHAARTIGSSTIIAADAPRPAMVQNARRFPAWYVVIGSRLRTQYGADVQFTCAESMCRHSKDDCDGAGSISGDVLILCPQ
jgi:hypothetical protein